MVKLDSKYKKSIGKVGEGLAEGYLLQKGFKILARNVVSWGGELDIVAEKDGIIQIVEVKTSKSFINPLEHVNYKKLLTLKRAAEHYVFFVLKTQKPYIISIISINLKPDETLKNIEFLENVEI